MPEFDIGYYYSPDPSIASDPNEPDKSYRSIALLPYLFKTFERIVHDQISKYLYDNSLLTNRQT